MESLEHVNGLYQQVDCAVCGTNNVRINGLEGVHTAFLIDGIPIMGALASVYGLNGLHPGMIEQIEVLKGPSSTAATTRSMGNRSTHIGSRRSATSGRPSQTKS